jgi:Protein of unknown function (DUF2917)
MQRHTDPALTRLASGASLTLPHGSGRGVAVFAGWVWITEEGDPRDHFLGAGDSLALRGEGRAVVQAFGAALLLTFDNVVAAA